MEAMGSNPYSAAMAEGGGRRRRDLVGALRSVVRPVWEFHRVLGPLSAVIWIGLSLWFGFALGAPGWGVAALLLALFALAVWDVMARIRQERERLTAEMELLSQCHESGEWALKDWVMCNVIFQVKLDDAGRFSDEDFETSRTQISNARSRLVDWRNKTEADIGNQMDAHAARLFCAHPGVTHSRPLPDEVADRGAELFNETASCLEWLAVQLNERYQSQR